MAPLAGAALEATRSGALVLEPTYWEKTWNHWLTQIEDWCVSRQLRWGHRIPVYTCARCEAVTAQVDAPTQCPACGHGALVQDPDVLDTWASSWLWPFAVHAGLVPKERQRAMEAFYPTDTLVTGPDIIFFWVARMVMAGAHFEGKIPFNRVCFTPIMRDAQGRKMSKSLGNSPRVSDLLAEFGPDVLRFAVLFQVAKGSDLAWDRGLCDTARNFSNKIWNAAKFLQASAARLQVQVDACVWESLPSPQSPLEHWLLGEFASAAQQICQHLAQLEFGEAARKAYEFTWMVFCDWYIELQKPLLGEPAGHRTLTSGLCVFEGLLRVLHPFVPHITEGIWQSLGDRTGSTLAGAPYPVGDTGSNQWVADMREVQRFVSQIRALRGEFAIHPGTVLEVTLREHEPVLSVSQLLPLLESLAKCRVSFGPRPPGGVASALVGSVEVYVNLVGLVDIGAETAKAQRKAEKLRGLIAGLERKLQGEFGRSAPGPVVAGAREQLERNRGELALVEANLASWQGSAP